MASSSQSQNITIKTLTVYKIAEDVLKTSNNQRVDKLMDFLQNQVPASSNYTVIKSRDAIGGWRSRVGEMCPVARPTQLTFAEHISLQGLTVKCKLTLSIDQAAMLSEFLEAANKFVRFNCPSSDSNDIVDSITFSSKYCVPDALASMDADSPPTSFKKQVSFKGNTTSNQATVMSSENHALQVLRRRQ